MLACDLALQLVKKNDTSSLRFYNSTKQGLNLFRYNTEIKSDFRENTQTDLKKQNPPREKMNKEVITFTFLLPYLITSGGAQYVKPDLDISFFRAKLRDTSLTPETFESNIMLIYFIFASSQLPSIWDVSEVYIYIL